MLCGLPSQVSYAVGPQGLYVRVSVRLFRARLCKGCAFFGLAFVVSCAVAVDCRAKGSAAWFALVSQALRPNKSLHPTPVVGFSHLVSAFAPARLSSGVRPQGQWQCCYGGEKLSEWTHALFIGGGIGLAGVLSGFSKYQTSRAKGLQKPPQSVIAMTSEEKIANYREEFRSNPLGLWTWACGTFSTMMDEDWEFLADGTGIINHFGTFHNFRGVTEFEWKSVADYTLSCRVTKHRWLYVEADGELWEEQDEEDWPEGMSSNWGKVRYDFHVVQSDCGSEVAMCSVQGDVKQAGFWFSEFCLSYCRPKKEVTEGSTSAV